MQYFDIHSHLNFHEFDADREAVMARLKESETGTIVVGTDLDTSKWAVEIANEHENVWACIGVHPVDDLKGIFELDKFEELIKNPKVVAVGECGLDFFHAKKEDDLERQKKLFLEQVDFAIKHDRPLMIHSREGYRELLEILEPIKMEQGEKLRGDVHFFAGSLEIAKRFWNIGFTTSFTGVITFPPRVDKRQRVEAGADNYIEVIKNAPLEMLMSETDAPFVAPALYRGKRNEPSYVQEVVKKIAEIREEDLETIKTALLNNVKRIFRIPA
jgi:TatD DNase family protein